MQVDERTTVSVQQSLFGYQDGHRLLASSFALDDESAASVLILSDLAVAASDVGDGYWTGVPLIKAKVYALIRTWLAPEMPRPGCVWSHALFISFADMARIKNLAAVANLAKYPSSPTMLHSYEAPLRLDIEASSDAFEVSFGRVDAAQILRTIYTGDAPELSRMPRSVLEGATIAVWSQQWPRLRRSFAFRTSRGVTYASSLGQLMAGADRSRTEIRLSGTLAVDSGSTDWEKAAVDDLFERNGGAFRQFVWRYGPDVKNGRERFKLMAEIYSAIQVDNLSGERLQSVLQSLVLQMPELSDGKLLKQHFMSAGHARYSLVPPCDSLAVLEFYQNRSGLPALPPPTDDLADSLTSDWTNEEDRLLKVTAGLIDHKLEFGQKLARRIAHSAVVGHFLKQTGAYPAVMRIAVAERPELLDDPAIATLQVGLIRDLLANLGENTVLAERLIDRLFGLDDNDIASTLTRKAPHAAVSRVLTALASAARGEQSPVKPAWLDVARRSDSIMDPRTALDHVTTYSELAAQAVLFEQSVPAGLRLSLQQWARALARSKDDVRRAERDGLFAYLFVLAITKPSPGCEPLLERTFETLHTGIVRGMLSTKALQVLDEHLPPLAWWKQWDSSGRLNLAVVNAYIDGALNVSSFYRLTDDKWVRARLIELAEDTRAGRNYLKQDFPSKD